MKDKTITSNEHLDNIWKFFEKNPIITCRINFDESSYKKFYGIVKSIIFDGEKYTVEVADFISVVYDNEEFKYGNRYTDKYLPLTLFKEFNPEREDEWTYITCDKAEFEQNKKLVDEYYNKIEEEKRYKESKKWFKDISLEDKLYIIITDEKYHTKYKGEHVVESMDNIDQYWIDLKVKNTYEDIIDVHVPRNDFMTNYQYNFKGDRILIGTDKEDLKKLRKKCEIF